MLPAPSATMQCGAWLFAPLHESDITALLSASSGVRLPACTVVFVSNTGCALSRRRKRGLAP